MSTIDHTHERLQLTPQCGLDCYLSCKNNAVSRSGSIFYKNGSIFRLVFDPDKQQLKCQISFLSILKLNSVIKISLLSIEYATISRLSLTVMHTQNSNMIQAAFFQICYTRDSNSCTHTMHYRCPCQLTNNNMIEALRTSQYIFFNTKP